MNSRWLWKNIRLRFIYYLRKFYIALWICPECYSRLNETTAGRKHCILCGKVKS